MKNDKHKETTATIYLSNFRDGSSRVISGRDMGMHARVESKIGSLFLENDWIQVLVPGDVLSVNPSFLEEFLREVVLKHGEKEFRRKVRFVGANVLYNVDSDVDEAISRIVRRGSFEKRKGNSVAEHLYVEPFAGADIVSVLRRVVRNHRLNSGTFPPAGSGFNQIRSLGFMEGVLVSQGHLKADGGEFPYEQIEQEEWDFPYFWRKRKTKRRQTYAEFILAQVDRFIHTKLSQSEATKEN